MARQPEYLAEKQRALGRYLAALREAAGLYQVDIARAMPCHRTTVTHAEAGSQLPDVDFWEIADRIVGADGALIARYDELIQAKAAHLAEQQAKRRVRAQATARELAMAPLSRSPKAPRTVTQWNSHSITFAVRQITREDLSIARREALSMGASVALAGAALTEPLQRWLFPISDDVKFATRGPDFSSTELDSLEGLDRCAQQYYVLSVQLAKLANDDGHAATVLAALARQCYDLGRPREGLEIVELAQYGSRKTATALLRAMLSTREAWGYAQLGESQAFTRAVGLAEEYFSEGTSDDDHRRVRYFDAAELAGVIGGRYRELARHEPRWARKAQDHIREALELRHPSKLRLRAFDFIGLARTQLIAADPQRACELVHQAIRSDSRG